jgi:hypothetical protein
MTIAVLQKIAKLNFNGERAIVATPISDAIKEEIDAGNVTSKPVKTGPLGLTTGEIFLDLTDAGRSKLSDV